MCTQLSLLYVLAFMTSLSCHYPGDPFTGPCSMSPQAWSVAPPSAVMTPSLDHLEAVGSCSKGSCLILISIVLPLHHSNLDLPLNFSSHLMSFALNLTKKQCHGSNICVSCNRANLVCNVEWQGGAQAMRTLHSWVELEKALEGTSQAGSLPPVPSVLWLNFCPFQRTQQAGKWHH